CVEDAGSAENGVCNSGGFYILQRQSNAVKPRRTTRCCASRTTEKEPEPGRIYAPSFAERSVGCLVPSCTSNPRYCKIFSTSGR
ncbi:unnamed protein product, partial [Urochloa humidicola]